MTKDVLFTVLWKGHIINSFFDKKNTEKLQLIILLQNSIRSKIVKQVLPLYFIVCGKNKNKINKIIK